MVRSNYAKALAVLGAAGTLAWPANGVIRNHVVPDTQYKALALSFPAVLKNVYSSVLIGDKWILTAAHANPGAGKTVQMTINGQTYTASNFVSHPQWNGSQIIKGFDFCVARLDRRVLDVEPMELYDRNDQQGKIGYIVGYGNSGDGLVGEQGSTAAFRAGTNLIEKIDADGDIYPNLLWTDFDSGTAVGNGLTTSDSSVASPLQTPLESSVGSGDSGGALILFDKGRPKLAGVTSFRFTNAAGSSSKYGSGAGFGRVSAVAQWIRNTARENGTVAFRVGLQDWLGSISSPEIVIELRKPGTTVADATIRTKLAINGSVSFVSPLRGTYDLAVKADTWLRKMVPSVNIADQGLQLPAMSLVNGDVDGDNAISVFDYQGLSDAFDSIPGSANWNARADLDGDGSVSIFDYQILSDNFDRFGDE